MDFSNSTTLDGVIQEIDRIAGSTDNTYSLKAKTARVNQALDRFFALALEEDGDWQFDDANQTDLPIGVANLVSGQYDYSFASELLMVSKVLAKDSSGNWNELYLMDQTEPESHQLYTLPTGNSGAPIRYDILANSILLDPIPNYNSTGGLKVIFKRNAVKFVSTDTTTDPGIPSLFHPYLCRYAALSFLIENRLGQAQGVAQLIQQDEEAIKDFMSNRNKVKKVKVKTVWRSAR